MDDAFTIPIGLNEETITEMLLLKLARQFAGRGIEVKSFNKHQEGTSYLGGPPTGADWEWRFEGPTGLGKTVRIEAKRLYMGDGKYGGLDGIGTRRTTLVSSSGSAIPLYVLYNGPSPSLLGHGRLGAFPYLKPHDRKYCYWPYYDLRLWGCAIASEPDVPNKNKPAPADFAWMEPWHALVCDCANSETADLGTSVSASLKRLYHRSREDIFLSLDFEPDRERPWWVSALVDGQPIEDLPEGVAGVALIRQLA